MADVNRYDEILLKVGVKFEPDIKLRKAIKTTAKVFKESGYLFIITSLKDRQHSSGSFHYYGMAFDCAIKHISNNDHIQHIYTVLVNELGASYNVFLERTHIHIQVKNEKNS
jgi:hypothetical protein